LKLTLLFEHALSNTMAQCPVSSPLNLVVVAVSQLTFGLFFFFFSYDPLCSSSFFFLLANTRYSSHHGWNPSPIPQHCCVLSGGMGLSIVFAVQSPRTLLANCGPALEFHNSGKGSLPERAIHLFSQKESWQASLSTHPPFTNTALSGTSLAMLSSSSFNQRVVLSVST
jgi:hypothetical protein